jgi:predicted nuclease of predicted toxin-antitoxin system
MKLILDAHLPASLAQYFPGHDVLHTSTLPDGNLTSDAIINQISILEDRVLITKDSDFYHSFVANRQPKRLVLAKLGNMKLKDLKAYFERNAGQMIGLLEDHSFLILEATKIRVLE